MPRYPNCTNTWPPLHDSVAQFAGALDTIYPRGVGSESLSSQGFPYS